MAKKELPAETAPVSYKFPVNEARGEARLMIDDVELVLAAEMGRLSAVSTRLQCRSLAELFTRLSGVEAAATWAGVELLTVRGDVARALEKLRLKHFSACGAAFTAILAHHFDGEEGNGEAGATPA